MRIIQQGLFLHLILSYLKDLERNRDRGATVPPVRFSRTARFGWVLWWSSFPELRAYELLRMLLSAGSGGGEPPKAPLVWETMGEIR